MAKWEYKVYNYSLNQEKLNILGEKGWELVSYTRTFAWIFVYLHKYIFKRKIED